MVFFDSGLMASSTRIFPRALPSLITEISRPPTSIFDPPTTPSTPFPGYDLKFFTLGIFIFLFFASLTIAFAIPCSECASTAAANLKISFSTFPTTENSPFVSVPVLSKTI